MENLIFSLNATLPVFLTMGLGAMFRKCRIITDEFAARMNRFVFAAALPVLLFQEISTVNFKDTWDGTYVLFCFLATLFGILIITVLSKLLKDRSVQGEFIQASYRSSAAILGIAFIQNIYGEVHMAPLMIIGSVPLYNIMAVLILSLVSTEKGKLTKKLLKKTCWNIVKNPIILGISAGVIWSLLEIPQPVILSKTINNLAVLATPMGLMAMGASVNTEKVKEKLKPALAGTFLKLILLPMILLPAAIMLGFQNEKLVAVLVMAGSATTVSCFVMAKNMGHEGDLTSAIVMLTTLLSAFSLTGWLFLLKSAGVV